MKRMKGLLMLGVTAVMMFALTGCGKTTVKLDKYVTITAEGYDSMGTASYDFDYDAFKKDYSGKIKTSKNSNELSGWGLLSGETSDELLLDFCVSQKLDKTSGLSNGDVVTLKWNCEDAMAEEYFNVKLDYSDVTYTVKGLEEVGKFNPFDYVTVTFSGISPNGSVTITPNYDKAEMQYVSFSADKNSGLKVGDSVTVTASISGSTDSFVEKFGAVLGKTEEAYTVENLAHYISDISDIPEDMYNKMDKQLQDVLAADFASWDNEYLRDMKLLGTYTITLKDGMSGSPNNYIYFVYSITAENDKSNGEFNYYWYGYYQDILILPDGLCSVDLGSYYVPDWKYGDDIVKFEGQGTYQYAGFKDLDSLFNKHVVSKIEKYEYKQTIQ
ncbi:MAG: hypothetical protein ACI4TA_10035 [Acetatifactor sp.]